jgi:phage repressor protein C with HTH and peptisase S24 domain
MSMDTVRKLILEKLAEKRLSMKDASISMGHAHSYLYQFLKRGIPLELHERDRISLAAILHIHEDELRGSSTPPPKRSSVKQAGNSPNSLVDPTAPSPPHLREAQRASPIPSAELFGNMDLPVFGTAQGGDGALIITDRAVDWVARPSILLRVADGYGMIVTGDSMDPALKSGATALINPHLPPRVGDLCLFRCHKDDGATVAAIKEFRGETETLWKVRQHNPAKDFALKKADWQVCHRVVGSYFP